MHASDYTSRAIQHRPTDPGALAGEIRRLRGTGLTSRDIACALDLDLGVVLVALRSSSPADLR